MISLNNPIQAGPTVEVVAETATEIATNFIKHVYDKGDTTIGISNVMECASS